MRFLRLHVPLQPHPLLSWYWQRARLRVPRSRFRQQLRPGVDMTSDVKDWEQLFYVRIRVFSFCLSEESEPVKHDG